MRKSHGTGTGFTTQLGFWIPVQPSPQELAAAAAKASAPAAIQPLPQPQGPSKARRQPVEVSDKPVAVRRDTPVALAYCGLTVCQHRACRSRNLAVPELSAPCLRAKSKACLAGALSRALCKLVAAATPWQPRTLQRDLQLPGPVWCSRDVTPEPARMRRPCS